MEKAYFRDLGGFIRNYKILKYSSCSILKMNPSQFLFLRNWIAFLFGFEKYQLEKRVVNKEKKSEYLYIFKVFPTIIYNF